MDAILLARSPRTYSIAKYGRPRGVVRESKAFASAGWSISAKCLTGGFELRYNLRRVRSQLDDLERDLPTQRACLFRQPNLAHAPFARDLQQSICANSAALYVEGALRLCLRGIVLERRAEGDFAHGVLQTGPAQFTRVGTDRG